MTNKELGAECEKAIQFLCTHMTDAEEWRKPVLFHGVRVGTRLYNDGYSSTIVIAGFLHDVLEDCADVSVELLEKEFGEEVAKLVQANSKDLSIEDKAKRAEDLITRCTAVGEDALIIKAADILDNFAYYESIDDTEQLHNHCLRHAQLLLEKKLPSFSDPIFGELENVCKKYPSTQTP